MFGKSHKEIQELADNIKELEDNIKELTAHIKVLQNQLIHLQDKMLKLDGSIRTHATKSDIKTIRTELTAIKTSIQPKKKNHKQLQEKIMEALEQHGELSTSELIQLLDVRPILPYFYDALYELEDNGKIIRYRVGKTKRIRSTGYPQDIMESLVDL